MLADPVEKTQAKQKTKAPSISATNLAGRDQSTSVDLRWYPNNEFKKLSSEQKKELMNLLKPPARLEAIKKGRKAEPLKRKAGSEGGNGGRNNDDGFSESKRQKKYQNAVMKQAKKIVAAALEADGAEEEALDAKIDAAMKRLENISSTTVATPAEGKVNDKAARLSSILGRITLQKKTVTLPEDGK